MPREKIPPHPRNLPDTSAPGAAAIKELLGDAADLASRTIETQGIRVSLLFIDGLVNSQYVADEIVRPLTGHPALQAADTPETLLDAVEDGGVYGHSCKRRDSAYQTALDILSGSVAVLPEGSETCVTLEAKGFPMRSVSEPSNESIHKGAKDSFIENLRSNTALVRRKIKNPALRLCETVVGRQTATGVCVVWIEGLTNPALVKRVLKRLGDIDIDGLISASQLEEYLIDNKYTAFPQLLASERVDKFAANVVAGRVGLLVDGLPVSYVLPGSFAEFMHAPEDYSQNYIMASLVTLLRYACLFISLTLPAFYLSVVCYHQDIMPTSLAQSIIQAKQDVPFGSTLEVLGMLAAFEILLEAGMRLPKPIGQTVSIVGALVVGQAAVEAKFVSPAVVIVIAMTGIAGFTSPNQDMSAAIRIWRVVLTLFAAQLGLFGLCLGCVLLIYHLTGITSFGVPYLSPFGSDDAGDVLTRTIIRPPLHFMFRRERSLGTLNKRNQGKSE